MDDSANASSAATAAPKGFKLFKAKHFDVNDTLVHLMPQHVQGTQAASNRGSFTPTKKELKMMNEVFMQEMKDSHEARKDVVAEVGKSRLILKKSEETAAFEQRTAWVYLISWVGKGKLTEPDDEEYRRIPLEQPNEYGLKYRWSKAVMGAPEKEGEDQLARLAKLLAKNSPKDDSNYIGILVRYSFHRIEGRLQDLVHTACDSSDPSFKNFWTEAINKVLATDFDAISTSGNKKYVALHGHKSYKPKEMGWSNVRGLEFVRGTARKIYLTGRQEAPLMLWEEPCKKLFFPNVSVADFMVTYLRSGSSLADMKEAMKGLKVQIEQRGQEETRHILELDDIQHKVERKMRHGAWWKMGDQRLQHPDLPTLNVGTPSKRDVIPAEMCTILPMQSVGRHLPLSVQSATTSALQLASNEKLSTVTKKGAKPPASPKLTVEQGKDRFRAAFDNTQPKILFVQAGTSKALPKGWTRLCSRVSSNADISSTDDDTSKGELSKTEPAVDQKPKEDDEKSESDASDTTDAHESPQRTPMLSLRFKPGNDHSSLWKMQLDKFISTHSAEDEKVLLVIAVGPGEHHHKIYQTLKTLCDSDQVGKQTFFVNTKTLEKKQAETSKAALKAANEISRRMRIRNPPKTSMEDADLAIGLHVTRFCAEGQTVGDDGNIHTKKQSFLLVSTVSRDLKKACGYRTTRKLLTDLEIQKFNPGDHIKSHLNGNKTGNVVVCRSGWMQPVEVGDKEITIDSRNLAEIQDAKFHGAAHLETTFTESTSTATVAPVSEGTTKLITSSTELANNEIFHIQQAVAEHRENQENNVSYILLEEGFNLASVAQQVLTQEVADPALLSAAAGKELTIANVGRSSDIILGTTPLGPKDGKLRTSRPSSSKSTNKVLSMTFLGKPVTARRPFTLSQRRHSSGSSTGDEGCATAVDERSPAGIQQDELDLVASLFKDDYLELPESKLPIPSYLAQAAAKRAMMHMTASRKNSLGLPTLPKIAPEVASSLYYL